MGFNTSWQKWDAALTPATAVAFDAAAKAVVFNGAGGFASFGPTLFGGPLTVQLVVRPDELAATVRVLDFHSVSATPASRLSLSISSADGAGSVELFSAAGGAAVASHTTAPLTPLFSARSWSHVALSVDAAGSARLYLNGLALGGDFQLAPVPAEVRGGFIGRGPLTGTIASERWLAGALANFQARIRAPLKPCITPAAHCVYAAAPVPLITPAVLRVTRWLTPTPPRFL